MSSGYYRLGANVPGKGKVIGSIAPIPHKPPPPALADTLTRLEKAQTLMAVVSEDTTRQLARQQGYTGDVCTYCHGVRVRNNGTCKVCEDCGTTTGCS